MAEKTSEQVVTSQLRCPLRATGLSDIGDSDLRKLVQVVVRDFNGDTSAFFESLGGNSKVEIQEQDSDPRTAYRFLKDSVSASR